MPVVINILARGPQLLSLVLKKKIVTSDYTTLSHMLFQIKLSSSKSMYGGIGLWLGN